MDLEEVLAKFEDYCMPRKNETYVTDLRLKIQPYNFGTFKESMIHDQTVIGELDKRVRIELLKETDLTEEKAKHPRAQRFT